MYATDTFIVSYEDLPVVPIRILRTQNNYILGLLQGFQRLEIIIVMYICDINTILHPF